MIALTLTALLAAASQPETLWCDASEACGGVEVTAPGPFDCWLWVEGDAGDTVWCTVGGMSLSVRLAEPGARWVLAGVVALEAGKATLAPGRGVDMIVLSNVEGFDPVAAMGDRRVNPMPTAVEDAREHRAKHTDWVFTMPHFDSLDAWEARAEVLRRRVLLSSGLYPLPERTPLNADIQPVAEHEDYIVEKVRFEARPGFLVTGNLYRPKGDGPFPATVSPHGHWPEGRLVDDERGSVPARGITFARMGIVAFCYDMIGYNDSQQFPHGFGGEQEKLWGLHAFGMQLWSSIRAMDFVADLPYVDPGRLGCTGASGGGTQTFALFAVEPRVRVAAPVNMISSTMQGGCGCENAPILRLDNSNMEIGALMAPRPLMMVSATGDWTRETPRVEYPAIRSIYALYGAQDQVEEHQVDAGHNYNRESREAVYRFFGKHLLGGHDWSSFSEADYTVEPDAAMRVFPNDADLSAWPDMDTLVEQIVADTRAKWDAELAPVKPGDAAARAAFRAKHGTVLAEVMGVAAPGVNDLRLERMSMEEREDHVVERWVIGRACVDDTVPALLYRSRDAGPQDAVLLVDGEGKATYADPTHVGPGPLVRALLDRGKAVLAIDTFLIGEHQPPAQHTDRLRAGQFMDTFEPTDTGCRVQDVLTALTFLRARRDITDDLAVVGTGDGGVWAMLAAACPGGAPRTVADVRGFDLDNDAAWARRFYIPCIRAVGDLRTATVLAPEGGLTIIGGARAEMLEDYGVDVGNIWPGDARLAGML